MTNEKLREALEKIDRHVSHAKLGDWSIALDEIRKIARAALSSTDSRSVGDGELTNSDRIAASIGLGRFPKKVSDDDVREWLNQRRQSQAFSDAVDGISAMSIREAGLREALIQHNDRLRSAMQIANRNGADTNWLAFRGQCQYTLAEFHDIVNDARAALNAGGDRG